MNDYAEQSISALKTLHAQCFSGDSVYVEQEFSEHLPMVPDQAIGALTDFIEYSEDDEGVLIERLISEVQVHRSRTHKLAGSRAPRHSIESSIVDAGVVFALASAAYRYARRENDHMPQNILWTDVKSALQLMRLREHEFPSIHKLLDLYSERTEGPR